MPDKTVVQNLPPDWKPTPPDYTDMRNWQLQNLPFIVLDTTAVEPPYMTIILIGNKPWQKSYGGWATWHTEYEEKRTYETLGELVEKEIGRPDYTVTLLWWGTHWDGEGDRCQRHCHSTEHYYSCNLPKDHTSECIPCDECGTLEDWVTYTISTPAERAITNIDLVKTSVVSNIVKNSHSSSKVNG